MLSVLFPESRYRGKFFAGSEKRLKNYYALALEGHLPTGRAEKFIIYRMKRTLEDRHIPKVLSHEFQHVIDLVDDVLFSEEKAYATEKNVEELKEISKAIKIIYL